MIERFNGRIKEVLHTHHFRSGGELDGLQLLRPALQPAAPAIDLGEQDALAGQAGLAQTQAATVQEAAMLTAET